MIRFENISKGAITAGSPEWQNEIIKFANTDENIQRQALEVSNELAAAFNEQKDKVQAGYFGTFLTGLLEKTPRYIYIKNVVDGNGKMHDAKVDLIQHTVEFVPHS